MNIKKEDLRRVKITKFDDGSGDYTIDGYFHKWIEESEYNDMAQVLNKNYAIVEFENGTVELIKHYRIKFLD